METIKPENAEENLVIPTPASLSASGDISRSLTEYYSEKECTEIKGLLLMLKTHMLCRQNPHPPKE